MHRRSFSEALFASALATAAGLTPTRPAAAQVAGAGRLLGPAYLFTASGIYTPSAGSSAIYVVAIGGGGGAGGAAWSGTGSVTGGGGGGAVGASYFSPVASGYPFQCGKGGAGGLPGQDGIRAGDTFFAALTANGGVFSLGATGGVLASPGANVAPISGWDINIDGRGGGLAFKSGAFAVSGSGGNGPHGTGGGGRPTDGPGLPASGFGAGGGGANALSSSQSGGTGSDGALLVWEFS
jgi:hypothetical protein